ERRPVQADDAPDQQAVELRRNVKHRLEPHLTVFEVELEVAVSETVVRTGQELGHLEPALRRHAMWRNRVQQDQVPLLERLRVEVPTPLGAGKLREEDRRADDLGIWPAVLDE